MSTHESPHVEAPPERANLALVIGVPAVLVLLLVAQAHAPWLWLRVLCALAFGVTGITVYQVKHEAEHGVLFRSERANAIGGMWMAAWFCGAFSLMRSCHLGHHARNRTEAECFELYWPGQSRVVRTLLHWSFFLFGFWALVPLSTLGVAVTPRALRARIVALSERTATMAEGTPPHWLTRIQQEAWFTIALHAALIAFVIPWHVWLTSYLAVAVIWSSQNYLGHAGDQRFDVVDGCFNLDVNPIYGAWILGFHWHLAHHQNPKVPWLYLSRYDDVRVPHRSYARAYLRFLAGPTRAPPGAPVPPRFRSNAPAPP